ncbi:hypothetical protein CROQUDRAFT_658323 [Cronartium quercuum f. sp. fusiforme G11]|uniref:BZIP domain-containing protein n=1 Tax=Cronartium quercuum f. sp. fusiforme G11 TaxID=708437 RepID=A0A9P6TAY0_9BASI|nr:hypothetical protein CROQUDRAFT_658323 [Cronartium quercuum f. sp. fusiforme G11]
MKRGRKQDDTLPPSRSREIQRAFRQRRSDYIRGLEKRVQELQMEVDQILSQRGEPLRYTSLPVEPEPPVGCKKPKTKAKQTLPNFMDLKAPAEMVSRSNPTLLQQSDTPLCPISRPPTAFGPISDYFVDNSYEIHDYLPSVPVSHHSRSGIARDSRAADSKPNVAEDSKNNFHRSYSPLPCQRALDQRWDSHSQITPSTNSSRSSPYSGVPAYHQHSSMYAEENLGSQDRVMYPGLESTLSSQVRPLHLLPPMFSQRSVTAPQLAHTAHSIGTSTSTSSPERSTVPDVGYDCYESPPSMEAAPYDYPPTEDLSFEGHFRPYSVFESPNDQPNDLSPYRNEETSPYNRSAGPVLQSVVSDSHLGAFTSHGSFEDEDAHLNHSQFDYHSTRLQPAVILTPSGSVSTPTSLDSTEMQLITSTSHESTRDMVTPSMVTCDIQECDQVDLDVGLKHDSPALTLYSGELC